MPGRKETRPVGKIETVGVVAKPDDAEVGAAATALARRLAGRNVARMLPFNMVEGSPAEPSSRWRHGIRRKPKPSAA